LTAVRFLAGLAVLTLASSCADAEPDPVGGAEGTPVPEVDGNFIRRMYERNFVFASLDSDSVFIVPWMMQTLESPDTVMRDAWAWLARGGMWDRFFAERWWPPPTRSARQVLPHGNLSFLVRYGDAIDGILFDEQSRTLELILGEVEASWTDARGGSFEVLTGAAYLGDQKIDGMVLDMARASIGTTPPGGDWAFLLSGDSARFVLAADSEYGGEAEPIYRAWADLQEEELQWPEVRVDWQRVEAFPPSRRDIPAAWLIWSADGLMEGQLEAVSAEIQPGQGRGPLLPVRALFEVAGDITTIDGTYSVHGILVHERR
jgi:hypothetical protein